MFFLKFHNLKVLFIICLFTFSVNSFAKKDEFDLAGDSLRDAQLVIGTASAGAILGLSTLSFVEEPKEHLKSVVVGAALGIILGVGVVAWQQASKSRDFYLKHAEPKAMFMPEFIRDQRMTWHYSERANNLVRDSISSEILINKQFRF